MTPDRTSADHASRIAAITVGVVASALLIVLPLARWAFDSDRQPFGAGDRSKVTVVTKRAPTENGGASLTRTRTEETSARDSLLDRTLGSSEMNVLLRLLMIAAAAFLAAVIVQRVWLAQYAVTVGPVAIPALEAAAVQQAVQAVVRGLPDVKLPLPADVPLTMQRRPLFTDIEDARGKFLAFLLELEARLRRLASAQRIEPRLSLDVLIDRLQHQGVVDEAAAKGLRQLTEMRERVIRGADVDPDTLKEFAGGETAHRLLYQLGHLATTIQERRPAIQRREPSPPDAEEDGLNEVLSHAVRDDEGRLVLRRVNALSGERCLMPIDESGAPLTYWAPPRERDEDAFRDEAGNVLMGVTVGPHGGILAMPVDEHLRPITSLVAIVGAEHELLAEPQGPWPIEEPPPPVEDENSATAEIDRVLRQRGASHEGGGYVTTRIRSADGGWADIVIDSEGARVETTVDLAAVGLSEDHETARLGFMRGLGGFIAIVLDNQGRPKHGAANLARLERVESSDSPIGSSAAGDPPRQRAAAGKTRSKDEGS